MASIELCYLLAVEAIERFQKKSLSPVELMEAVIERAEEVEPKINPFTFKYYDEGMQAARIIIQSYWKAVSRA